LQSGAAWLGNRCPTTDVAVFETAVGRYKHLIGPTLRARSLPGQHGEGDLAVHVLNRMIRVAKPVSVRAV